MSKSTRADQVVGVVLAGGLSRRMFAGASGAGDKALLDLSGRPMLEHVIARLAPQVSTVVINANGDPSRFAAFALPVIADTVEGFVGPLAGVLAGLRWAKSHAPSAHWIVTASADAPLLPAELVERLPAALEPRPNAIAIARSDGHLHPVIGLWPVALADDLETALRDGVRKVLAWTDRHGTVPVDFPLLPAGSRSIDPFFNANTPAELQELRDLIDAAAPPTPERS